MFSLDLITGEEISRPTARFPQASSELQVSILNNIEKELKTAIESFEKEKSVLNEEKLRLMNLYKSNESRFNSLRGSIQTSQQQSKLQFEKDTIELLNKVTELSRINLRYEEKLKDRDTLSSARINDCERLELEAQIRQFDQENSAISEENEQILAQIMTHEKRMRTAVEQKNSAYLKMKECSNLLLKLQNGLGKMMESQYTLQKSFHQLQEALSSSFNNATQILPDYENKLRSLNKEISELKFELEKRENQNNSLVRKLQSHLPSHSSQITPQISSQSDLRKLERMLQESTIRIDMLESQLSSSDLKSSRQRYSQSISNNSFDGSTYERSTSSPQPSSIKPPSRSRSRNI
jgi:hypothetical protein